MEIVQQQQAKAWALGLNVQYSDEEKAGKSIIIGGGG